MKKMIVAAAATLAGVAFGVTSENIVGYNSALSVNEGGFTTQGACFMNIGDDALSLSSVIASDGCDLGSLELWVVNSALTSTLKAYWFAAADIDGVHYDAGWYDKDGAEPVNVDLAGGVGVLLKTGDAGVTTTQSGEVLSSNITVPVSQGGFTILSNPYAVDLTIENIVASDGCDLGSLELWAVNGALTSTKKAYWFAAADIDGVHYDAGWYDKDGVENQTYTIKPGEGVLLKTGDAGVTVTLTSPITL